MIALVTLIAEAARPAASQAPPIACECPHGRWGPRAVGSGGGVRPSLKFFSCTRSGDRVSLSACLDDCGLDPGAIYHVLRGATVEDIVCDDRDRERLGAFLGRAVLRYQWRVFAFVILTNHLHLVLKSLCPT